MRAFMEQKNIPADQKSVLLKCIQLLKSIIIIAAIIHHSKMFDYKLSARPFIQDSKIRAKNSFLIKHI